MIQRAYWDRVAATKAFTHELGSDWLALFPDTARVLDYGCGYGRTLRALASIGKTALIGYDLSEEMIARGRRENEALDLRFLPELPLSEPDQSVDVVLVLAVLTCVPDDRDQDAIMRELYRVLRPGGMLILSDMPLQTDARNEARYDAALKRFGTRGVFETEDGAIVRHHSPDRLSALLRDFALMESRTIALHTMNGHAATAIQMLAHKAG